MASSQSKGSFALFFLALVGLLEELAEQKQDPPMRKPATGKKEK